MMYFWLIPVLILLIVLVWALYYSATKDKRAGIKSEGKTLVDKPKDET